MTGSESLVAGIWATLIVWVVLTSIGHRAALQHVEGQIKALRDEVERLGGVRL